jgi:hypothetical protein
MKVYHSLFKSHHTITKILKKEYSKVTIKNDAKGITSFIANKELS